MDFEKTYQKVRGTVLKCHREFYLHLWDTCDWEQEGMIVLYHLIEENPIVLEDDDKLHVYLKPNSGTISLTRSGCRRLKNEP